MIDDCVSEQLIEPRHDTLFVSNLVHLRETLRVSLLEDVLGDRCALNAGAKEIEKPAVVLREKPISSLRAHLTRLRRRTCKRFGLLSRPLRAADSLQVGYKTGIVQWAEAQQRRAEPHR
jgi:hypothetical protein